MIRIEMDGVNEFIITDLADTIGEYIYYIFEFLKAFTNGYVILMAVLTMAAAVFLYFRFAKKVMYIGAKE